MGAETVQKLFLDKSPNFTVSCQQCLLRSSAPKAIQRGYARVVKKLKRKKNIWYLG